MDAEPTSPVRGSRGRTIAIAAIVGGILLAVGGSVLILRTGGLRDGGAPMGPSSIDVHQFDRSCTTDDECVVVLPAKCTECACVGAAIARAELERFNRQFASLHCPPRPVAKQTIDCEACVLPAPECNEGRCVVPGP